MSQRDAVVGAIYEAAKKDRDILFLNADLGAPALDAFREEMPDQHIFVGIAEQSLIDVASGLASEGKKVFCYAMSPFYLRAIEQVKVVLSYTKRPVTIIGVGAGLGYDHSTLTHFTVEDVAAFRAINGMTIETPSDDYSARLLAENAIANPALRYLRLERLTMPDIRSDMDMDRGFDVLGGYDGDVAIVTSGYLTHKALEARDAVNALGYQASVIDLVRVKPLGPITEVLQSFARVVTVEEHILDGGMGAAICEQLIDRGRLLPIKRLGLMDGFEVWNGDRAELHRRYKLDVPDIIDAALG